MTCGDHQRSINRFIDHEIKASECAELFEHLGTCMECRRFYDSIIALGAELDKVHLTIDEMPATGWQPGVEANRQPEYRVPGQRRIAPRSSSLIFAIVAILLVTLLFSINVTIEKPAQIAPTAEMSQQ
ncbi:MAG: zf-HC2 domain-containing protein [Bacteroidota bacterium]